MIVDLYSFEALHDLDKDFRSMMDDNSDVIARRDEDSTWQSSNNNDQAKSLDFLDREASLAMTNPLIQKALLLEQYIINLFPISKEMKEIAHQAKIAAKMADFKKRFMQKRVMRAYRTEEITDDFKDKFFASMSLSSFVDYVLEMLDSVESEIDKDQLEKAIKYASYKMHKDPDHSVFNMPRQIDFENLVGKDKKFVKKSGKDEAHYCIFCHNQEKDFCRTGMEHKTNPLENKLNGCPLGQKISEMNYLYSKGHIIAALAITMIDNPLVAATGHRVCNDCMKSCIFQKQEPVDIPCIESDMLRDVLKLPFGAEIYYLFTRWNPICDYIMKPLKDSHVLVAGLGPAGFAFSYYMLREGYEVVAIDSMDIKPLPEVFFEPIENWYNFIGEYYPQGFGGVAEYGITDRWDKNNLLLIRMLLERFENFQIIRKAKFGDRFMLDDVLKFYDHTAICIGAGSPVVPDVKNIDAKGVESAFTFLYRANLLEKHDPLIRMPAIVLGAGLTGVDSATELKNSYIKQISDSDNRDDPEFAAHYKMLQNNDLSFLDVSIIYRKTIQQSPSYRENHEELQVAIDEGVKFVENTELKNIQTDKDGRIESINDGDIPAKTIIYAYSTHPNDKLIDTKLLKENKDKISILGDLNPKYSGTVVKAIASAKDKSEELV